MPLFNIHVDVHVHGAAGERMLHDILRALDCLKKDILMAITVGEQAIVDSLNTASTKIGDRIAALIAAEPNITPEGQAAFAEVVAKLTALGTDPNNPVPANVTSFTKGRP